MKCDLLMRIQEMEIAADLGQVREIWLNGAKKAHAPHIREAFWDQRLSAFAGEARDATERYVYKDEGSQIRAFLLAIAKGDGYGYILELYVDDDFQNQGIGTALFNTLKGQNPQLPQLKGRYGTFTSSVYAHNDTSVAWHMKNKFKIGGVMFCPHTGLPKLEMMWKRPDRPVD